MAAAAQSGSSARRVIAKRKTNSASLGEPGAEPVPAGLPQCALAAPPRQSRGSGSPRARSLPPAPRLLVAGGNGPQEHSSRAHAAGMRILLRNQAGSRCLASPKATILPSPGAGSSGREYCSLPLCSFTVQIPSAHLQEGHVDAQSRGTHRTGVFPS